MQKDGLNITMSAWKYNKEIFKEASKDHVGFVYEIYDTETKMKYIGKKKFWSKVTRPPLKGKKNKKPKRNNSTDTLLHTFVRNSNRLNFVC